MPELEFEVVEEYSLLGEPRYRVKVKGTNVVINVKAHSKEEAIAKARRIAETVSLKKLVKG